MSYPDPQKAKASPGAAAGQPRTLLQALNMRLFPFGIFLANVNVRGGGPAPDPGRAVAS